MHPMIRYREETLRKRVAEIEGAFQQGLDYNEFLQERYFERKEEGECLDKRRIKPLFCRAFINNFSFPKSLEELKRHIDIGFFDIEDLLSSIEVSWTVPRWATAGDICLFMHAKYANQTISKLKSELKNNRNRYQDVYDIMMQWLDRGKSLHDQYGGKIICIARVIDKPEHADIDSQYIHWGSRTSAQLGDIWHLDNPIDLSEFNSFITVSRQSAITPLFGKDYLKLKNLIIEKNPILPDYFLSAQVDDMPISRMNSENWLRISYEYRYSFLFEAQFRSYYVDFFLKELGDQKKIFSECRCVKPGVTNMSRVDNVIHFCGRYLPVEIKLSVPNEPDIIGQVTKYCNDSEVFLTKDEKRAAKIGRFYNNHVLVIDTGNIFLYDDRTSVLQDIKDLDEIRNLNDIADFRKYLANILIADYPDLKLENKRSNRRSSKKAVR